MGWCLLSQTAFIQAWTLLIVGPFLDRYISASWAEIASEEQSLILWLEDKFCKGERAPAGTDAFFKCSCSIATSPV
ncbi:hypothetical protein WJX79_010982 [Trebouxia sp. C0005]